MEKNSQFFGMEVSWLVGHRAPKERLWMRVQEVRVPHFVVLPALQGPRSPFTSALFNAAVNHSCCQTFPLAPNSLASCTVISGGA